MLEPEIIEAASPGEFKEKLKEFLNRKKIVIESVNYSTGVSASDEIWYSALIIWRKATKEDPNFNEQ